MAQLGEELQAPHRPQLKLRLHSSNSQNWIANFVIRAIMNNDSWPARKSSSNPYNSWSIVFIAPFAKLFSWEHVFSQKIYFMWFCSTYTLPTWVDQICLGDRKMFTWLMTMKDPIKSHKLVYVFLRNPQEWSSPMVPQFLLSSFCETPYEFKMLHASHNLRKHLVGCRREAAYWPYGGTILPQVPRYFY